MSRIRPMGRGLLVLILGLTGPALAQERIEGFATAPQLVFNAGSHHAPINRLLFSADGSTLYSAGDDRVIHAWSLGAEPKWTRSLRPLVWTGRRGVIDAMALVAVEPGGTPSPGLVAGGYGVTNRLGDLGYFRLRNDPNAPSNPLDAIWNDHRAVVMAIASDPAGARVATSSFDGTVRIRNLRDPLDPQTRRPIFRDRILTVGQDPAQLLPPEGTMPVASTWIPGRSLSFDPSGRWVLANGSSPTASGLLFLWDLQAGPQAERSPRIRRGDGKVKDPVLMNPITATAISPNGKTVLVGLNAPMVFGQVTSGLIQLDFPSLTNPRPLPFLNPDNQPLGKVNAITFLDDQSVATAIDDRPMVGATLGQKPNVRTWVEIRQTSDGRVIERVGNGGKPWPGPVSSLAYAPKKRWLAFADADRREILIKDVGNGWLKPDLPLIRATEGAAAQGRAILDVAFQGEGGEFVAFRRGEPNAPFRGCDLTKPLIAFDVVPENTLARAQTTWNGWKAEPLSPRQIRVTPPQGNALTIDLPLGTLGRWYAYSFLPTTAKRTVPCLAIACRFGIAIYRLDGQAPALTRFLRGHSSDVTALAPSRNGRWLISGSADQSVRLWVLDGCEEVKRFGATIEPNGADWNVTGVAARSPADLLGLLPGDKIRAITVVDEANSALSKTLPLDAQAIERLDRDAPGPMIQVVFRRGNEDTDRSLSESKYDDPALSLFVDENEDDWVAWMPSGYYITSVAGDRRFVGFQINKTSPLDFNPQTPPDFVPLSQFEKQFLRKNVIDNLLRTGDVAGSIALGLVANVPPPVEDLPMAAQLEVNANDLARDPMPPGVPGVLVTAVTLPVTVTSPDNRRKLARLEVLDNGMIEHDMPFNPPTAHVALKLTFAIGEGDHRKTLVLVSDTGSRREIDWPYRGQRPRKPVERKPRLELLSFGPSFKNQGKLDRTPSRTTLTDVTKRLDRMTLEPVKRAHYRGIAEPGPAADRAVDTAESFRREIERLLREAEEGRLGASKFDSAYAELDQPVDTVVLVIDTHVLKAQRDESPSQSRSLVLGSDYNSGDDTGAISGPDLATSLGELTRRGCRVLVVLDGCHEIPDTREHGVESLARDLVKARVDVFVASENRVSDPGVFLKATDTVLRLGKGLVGGRKSYTADLLLQALRLEVETNSRRVQKVTFRPGEGEVWLTAPLARPR